jgi:hypothetical protein
MLHKDLDGAGTHERIDLRIQGLPPGADSGIANHVLAHTAASQ